MLILEKKTEIKVHVGPMPPPLGGISVYFYRLMRKYPQDVYINTSKHCRFAFVKLCFISNKEIIIHEMRCTMMLLLQWSKLFFPKSYSVVLHGEDWLEDYLSGSKFRQWMIKTSLKHCERIQVVGNHIKSSLLMYFPSLKSKILVRCAFLPPPLEDEPKILATYPDEMRNFMEVQRPLIVANAFQLADWNGTDLYGLDMCIELIHRLKKEYPSVGLLFALANEQYRPDYYAKMRDLIADYGLQRNVYFLTDQHELWPILKDCDVMVRPTCTDGYGVSVAETLYFNRPAVASDVCKRSDGCVVFRNRDMYDFEAKVRQVLEQNHVVY